MPQFYSPQYREMVLAQVRAGRPVLELAADQWPPTSSQGQTQLIDRTTAEDLVNRDFSRDGPNRL